MDLGKCTGWPFCDVDPRSRCDIDEQKFARLQDKVRTSHPIITKLDSYIPLVMNITWLDFEKIPLEIFWGKFSLKISDVIFQGQTLLDISQE